MRVGVGAEAEIVTGAWDFERINRRYARHLKILGERPGGALRNDATAKALLRWAAAEREAWLEAVTNDPLLPCPPNTWGNRHGGGGWKCSGTPTGKCAPSAAPHPATISKSSFDQRIACAQLRKGREIPIR